MLNLKLEAPTQSHIRLRLLAWSCFVGGPMEVMKGLVLKSHTLALRHLRLYTLQSTSRSVSQLWSLHNWVLTQHTQVQGPCTIRTMLYQGSRTIQRWVYSVCRIIRPWDMSLCLLKRSEPPVSTICPIWSRLLFTSKGKLFIVTIVVLRRISLLSFIGLVSIIVTSLLVWILLIIILLEVSRRPFSTVKLLNWVNFIETLIIFVWTRLMPITISVEWLLERLVLSTIISTRFVIVVVRD